MFSKHATQRMQQRGVSGLMVDLLIDYGAVDYHRGAQVIWLDKRGWRQLCRELPCPKQILDKVRRCYLVMAEGIIVTVGHKTTHFKTQRH